jgi:hypothetical protein
VLLHTVHTTHTGGPVFAALATPELGHDDAAARAVFFVSDSTGITVETLGGALLANFPHVRTRRHKL